MHFLPKTTVPSCVARKHIYGILLTSFLINEDLGNIYGRSGQVEQVRELWQEALCVYTELKLPKVETSRNLLEHQKQHSLSDQ